MTETLVIDGSYGEGGGQVLRTSLSLAALAGRRLAITNIRAGRPKPGLAAQHLTAVRAAAATCGAEVAGDALGSKALEFRPAGPPRAGSYAFDVAEAREGGSAGAATLVLQTVLLPLAFADGDSRVVVRGGTHVPWSPPFDFARDVWLATLARLGVAATLELAAWGWYPAGEGEVRLAVSGAARPSLGSLDLSEPGRLARVFGRAVACNLPAHIAQRMADRGRALLAGHGIKAEIQPLRVRAVSPGAGLFLAAEYENARAGFSALGKRGKAAEVVAEEAVADLVAHRDSGAAVDRHLADQLVPALALASGPSRYTTERVTRHLATSAWVVERFGLARVSIEGTEGGPGAVAVSPAPPGT